MAYRSGKWGKYLLDGEQLIACVRSHPVVLLRPFGLWLAAILLAWATGSAAVALDLWPVVGDAFGWLAAAVTVFAASRVLRWWRKCYAVTDLRVLSAGGLLASQVRSAALAKASDVAINRSPAGRLLGYGDVVVRSAGASFRFRTIGRPKQIYRLIGELVAGRPAVVDAGQARAAPPDPDLDKTGPLPRVIV